MSINDRAGVLIPLTAGNMRNNHIYVRAAKHLVPAGSLGGSNSESAGDNLTVSFLPGETVDTDIDATKMIFRNRSAVADFFKRTGASEGDHAIIHRVGPHSLEVSLLRK
ncbi:hypothetical protein H9L14_14260 [Sphingomonas sediminicola]|uniref:Uncharacterized protein n=1 Tax=Sphingomonas sediminicola TaxID=386874 RepID=A0ABX6T723_9SPHN|nr:hypothetical protein [Sphingomonas sediminicola]QNP45666.1 hypothetical protein H9L14_14260 [Sphingomonas sediminicola]